MAIIEKFECVQNRAQALLRMLSTKSVYKSNIFDILEFRGFGVK